MIGETIQLFLLGAAMLAMLALIAVRIRSTQSQVPETRLVLVDLVLLAAVIEALLDTLHDMTGDPAFFVVSAAGRGAVAIGVLALALSYWRNR